MSIVKETLCGSLYKQAENELKFLKQAQSVCGGQVSDINNKVSQASSINMPKVQMPEVPFGLDEMTKDANDLIKACTSFSTKFPNPSDMLSKLDPSDYIKGIFSKIPSLPSISFDISFGLDKLQGLFDDLKLDIHIPLLDQALNCLSQTCRDDVDSLIAEANSIMQSIGIGDDGKIDKDVLLSRLTESGRSRCSELFDGVTGAKKKFKNVVKSVF